MEKKKPTIDEIYKLNVDGLFESTANWFDNAFKKSQAEINRDLYNKINGYSSSSESTGGNVNLGPLLTSLNGSNLYPSRGYLYYNGNDWEFNTPTISGGGGGVVDTAAITKIVNDTIKNVSWWGQNINNNKVDGNIVITKGSHSFTIELDDNGNLKFNGNIYATGGITALGVGTTTGGSSGVSLGTLLTKLNSDNPFPTNNGQVLTYDGTNFVWKTPTGSGGSTNGGIRIKRNGNTLKDSNGNVLSCTSINFKYGENWNSTPILINSDNEISVDLSVVANNGNGSSSSSNYPLTIYNGSSGNDYITYDGSSSTYLRFKSGFSISKVGLGYEISVSGGGSGVTLNPTMSAMNDQLDKTSYGTPQFLYWDGSTYTWKNESEISGGSGSSSRIKNIKLFTNNSDYPFETIELGTADTIGFMQGDNITFQAVVKDFTNVIKISATGGGSGSNGTTSGKLYFRKDTDSYSEAYWNGESNFNIIFGSGLNVTWDSNSQITLSATGGSGGSSTGGSVDLSSYLTKTEASTTYAAKSHTHLASNITNFASTVKGIKVDDASHADAANKLSSSVYLWGNSFSGLRNIGSSTSNKADLRYVNNIYTGDTFGLYNTVNGIDTSLLSIDNTPNISVAYGYRSNENAILSLFGNKTKIYTNGQNYHFDFVRNVFDINSNQIHFGSETNGGKISWDVANNAFKIEGNVYATGGITALGVNNNATTSNNVDFTFRNVTANTFNVMDSIQLSDGLKLKRSAGDFDLISTDGNVNSFYFDGDNENYYLNTNGEAFFSNLDCETLSFAGVQNFKIVNAGSTTFTIQFEYNSKTYQFTPSGGSVTVS